MQHRGVIWTGQCSPLGCHNSVFCYPHKCLMHANIPIVLAFDAHVLSWSLDTPPPDIHTRHHIKEASFYGESLWTLEMVIRIPEKETGGKGSAGKSATQGVPQGAIEVSLSGIVEEAMWPGKKLEWKSRMEAGAKKRGKTTAAPSSVAMELFDSVAGWMDAETQGSTDIFGMHNVVWKGVL